MNSQDSGVHSDVHHPPSGHATPQLGHTNIQPLSKYRTLNNPVLKETVPRRVLPPPAPPSPPSTKKQEAAVTYKLPSIDKKEAVKYYTERSRYSPLTSRSSNHKMVGFGSRVPRFNDSAKINKMGGKRATPLLGLMATTTYTSTSTAVHHDRVIQRNDWTKRYRK